jgi:hypothetical protein
MKAAISIIRQDNLMFINGIAKRLPVMQVCEHEFWALHWDGEHGLIEYLGRPNLPFDDFDLVAPFVALWDAEPPQPTPFAIGAAPVYAGEDVLWTAVRARHTSPIDFDALVAPLLAAAVGERQTIETKQREAEEAWQAQQAALAIQRAEDALARRAARAAAEAEAEAGRT